MIDEIWAARERLKGVAVRTPLVPLRGAPVQAPAIYLKLESMQPGGSFKLRGLYNRFAKVRDEVKARGAKTVSAGNAAIAAAYACREMGASLEVLMGETASRAKIDAVKALGGSVVLRPYSYILEYIEKELWREESRYFVHPFDHPDVWAGHGTCGVEILEDLPGARTILVPIGGGGLVTGVARAVKALAPHVRVVGVQAAAQAPYPEALRTGQPARVPDPKPTIADGIAVPFVPPNPFAAVKECLDGCVTVTEEEIRDAIRLLALQNKLVAEGAGATATAAALRLTAADGPVVALVSGGNITSSLLSEILAQG